MKANWPRRPTKRQSGFSTTMKVDLTANPASPPPGAVLIEYEHPPLRAIYWASVAVTDTMEARQIFAAVKPSARIRTARLIER